MRSRRAWWRWGFLLAIALALAACGLGPATMRVNRLDYNITAQRSNSEQLLLNLVRMKYLEHPLFMQVGTIASSFSYSVSAGAIFNTNPATQQFPLGTTLSETPTVTYSPMDGQKYTQEILSEIDGQRFMVLFRANTHLEILLRCVLDRIGQLENQSPNRPINPQRLEAFRRFCHLASLMRTRGDLDIAHVVPEEKAKEKEKPKEEKAKAKGADKAKTKAKEPAKEEAKEEPKDKGPQLVMALRFANAQEAQEMAGLLGVPYRPLRLKSGQEILAFRLIEASLLGDTFGRDPRYVDLPFRMRSMREVLDYLGQGVQVPPGQPEASAASQVPLDHGGQMVDPYPYIKDFFEVRHADQRPAGAMVSVPYREGWYYIADSDLRSKLVFSFLSTLLALQSGNPPAHAPLLTLPIGG